METEWMAQGLCRFEPPATFFPSDGVGVEVAKRICASCPSQAPCLEYALENRIDHGVWGATSERQRRRILKRRRGTVITSDAPAPPPPSAPPVEAPTASTVTISHSR